MQNKRFIAGAICPGCELEDKIYIYLEDESQWRACAHCDFKEQFKEARDVRIEELTTRVNQNRVGEKSLAHETPLEAVKIIDPKS